MNEMLITTELNGSKTLKRRTKSIDNESVYLRTKIPRILEPAYIPLTSAEMQQDARNFPDAHYYNELGASTANTLMDVETVPELSEPVLLRDEISAGDSWLDSHLLIYENEESLSPMDYDMDSDDDDITSSYDKHRFTHVVVVNPDPGPIETRLNELRIQLSDSDEWLSKLVQNTEDSFDLNLLVIACGTCVHDLAFVALRFCPEIHAMPSISKLMELAYKLTDDSLSRAQIPEKYWRDIRLFSEYVKLGYIDPLGLSLRSFAQKLLQRSNSSALDKWKEAVFLLSKGRTVEAVAR